MKRLLIAALRRLVPRPSVWTALRALASVLAIVRIAGAARRRPPLDRRDADIAGSFPVAEELAGRGINLPSWHQLLPAQIAYIAQIMIAATEHKR